MKRIVILLFSIITMVLSAATVFADNKVVVDRGTCGADAYWELLEDNTLRIYGTGAVTDESGYVKYNEQAKKLIIEDGITGIGDFAFYEFSGLKGDLIIPDSVRTIGRDAFGWCEGFTGKLRLPKNLTRLEYCAFEYCTGLKGSLVIPDSVTVIEEGVFWGCSGLTGQLIIPDKVTSIGRGAFAQCSGLSGDLVIPDSVTELGEVVFYNCSGFDGTVYLSDNLTVIPDSLFENCFNLSGDIKIPDSVAMIEDDAFRDCSKITSITIPNPHCKIEFIGSDVHDTIAEGIELRVPAGSEGEAFAKRYGYPYVFVCLFDDVNEADYYYAPVLWAAENGITTGTSSMAFSPEQECTRAQIVTFLWRFMGEPEVQGENPFKDVTSDEYYYKAVVWAVENGITTGTSVDQFSPEEECTRAQTVTFLWRACGRTAAEYQQNPFEDVDAQSYYYDGVLWAVEKGITTGTSSTAFAPEEKCTRGQVVTFLYRTNDILK